MQIRSYVYEIAKTLFRDVDPEMGEKGTMFTHRELSIAADIYDFPIILLWYQNEMAYFDKLFNAFTDHGKTREPLYLLQLPHCYQKLIFKVKKVPKPKPIVKPTMPVVIEKAKTPIEETSEEELEEKVFLPIMKPLPMFPAPKKQKTFGKI